MTYKTDLFPDTTILFVEKFHFFSSMKFLQHMRRRIYDVIFVARRYKVIIIENVLRKKGGISFIGRFKLNADD